MLQCLHLGYVISDMYERKIISATRGVNQHDALQTSNRCHRGVLNDSLLSRVITTRYMEESSLRLSSRSQWIKLSSELMHRVRYMYTCLWNIIVASIGKTLREPQINLDQIYTQLILYLISSEKAWKIDPHPMWDNVGKNYFTVSCKRKRIYRNRAKWLAIRNPYLNKNLDISLGKITRNKKNTW